MKLISGAAVEFSYCVGPKEPTKRDFVDSGMSDIDYEYMIREKCDPYRPRLTKPRKGRKKRATQVSGAATPKEREK